MRRSLGIGGSSSVQWRKVGRSWRLRMCFRRLLCVRIEIDQLQCVNCWVIIHCLSVSCKMINHSRYALVIWSSLQLTSKQWIIKQQFTAGADLFLKLITPSYLESLCLSIFCTDLWLIILLVTIFVLWHTQSEESILVRPRVKIANRNPWYDKMGHFWRLLNFEPFWDIKVYFLDFLKDSCFTFFIPKVYKKKVC